MLENKALSPGQETAERAYVYCGFSSRNHYMQGSTRDDVYRVNSSTNAISSVRVPPYNTGKVLIGARYQPPSKLTYSRQEERLQSALLADPEELRQQRLDRWLYAVAVVALFVVIVTA